MSSVHQVCVNTPRVVVLYQYQCTLVLRTKNYIGTLGTFINLRTVPPIHTFINYMDMYVVHTPLVFIPFLKRPRLSTIKLLS
jgi:hypothetical protein